MTPLIGLMMLLGGCVIDTVPLPEDDPTTENLDNGAGGADSDTEAADPSPTDTSTDDNDGEDISSETDSGGQRDHGISLQQIYYSDDPVFLVGVPSAVAGAGTLTVTPATALTDSPTESATWSANTDSTDTGCFALEVPASVGDTVNLSFSRESLDPAVSDLMLNSGSVDAYRASNQLIRAFDNDDNSFSDTSNFTLAASATTSTISGDADSLAAGIGVVLANTTTGFAIMELVQRDGSFKVELEATSGDIIVLFAIEPATSNGGGGPLTITLP